MTQAEPGTRDDSGRVVTRRARRVRHERRPARPRQQGGILATLRETVIVLVVALVLASLLRAFVVQAFAVPSGSMENTLLGGDPGHVNDRIVVDKLPGQTVRRGQIVVFVDPGGWLQGEEVPVERTGAAGALARGLEFVGVLPDNSTGHLVKRVIGVGGDTVSCGGTGKPLEVNGHALTETAYVFPGSQACASTPDGPKSWSYTVPAGDLFVMGDNRDSSADSRFHPTDPFVPVGDVTGRVLAVVYPFDRLSRERIPADFAGIPSPSAATS